MNGKLKAVHERTVLYCYFIVWDKDSEKSEKTRAVITEKENIFTGVSTVQSEDLAVTSEIVRCSYIKDR